MDLVGYSTHLQYLALENVSFRFAGKKPQLQKINLRLHRGQVVALVGESGGGKSLICQIIQQFYKPESGQIMVNGSISLNQIDNQQWRAMVSVVPQHVHLFNGTVLANICLSQNPEEIEKATTLLIEYGFAPYLDALPQGIATIIGEEGVSLSGGQRQLIGLARALCYRPQLLIMDEATAALDRHSEQFVLDLVKRLRPQMAVLFITHRLHTLRSISDYIYVIEKGTFIAEGTHEQLLQSQNMYSDYWVQLTGSNG